LSSPGSGDLVTSTQQDTQGFPIAVAARHRKPLDVHTQRGQDCQPGIDAVRLALATAVLSADLTTSMTGTPAAAPA
jgi:hypothetical protein